jgi:hypothetical protein
LLALVQAFGPDAAAGALDGLGVDVALGQLAQEAAGVLVGGGVAAGVDSLPQQAGAVAVVVKAQALVLRGKKPAGSGGSRPGAAPS